MPAHVFAQFDSDGQTVIRTGPFGRQNGHVAVITFVDQRFDDFATDVVDACRRTQCGVQDPLFGDHVNDGRATLLDLLCRSDAGHQCGTCGQARDAKTDQLFLHV